MIRSYFLLSIVATCGLAAEWKFPCPENEIARYTAYRVTSPIQIDGRLDEACLELGSALATFP